MKLVKGYPPIWPQIVATGMKPDEKRVVITYGDSIYIPSGLQPSADLIEHEETHSVQQGDNPDKWWSRYIDDQYFRIEQETEAYAAQFAYVCAQQKDRNKRHIVLISLAKSLSGPTYGSVISMENAMKTIKQRSGVKP